MTIKTKHSIDRAIERLGQQGVRKNTKSKKRKIKKQILNHMNHDIDNYFAYYDVSITTKYIYSDLKIDNSCTKYVVGIKGRIVTVVKENIISEMTKIKSILFVQNLPKECFYFDKNLLNFFSYDYPQNGFSKKTIWDKDRTRIIKSYYVNIEKELQNHNLNDPKKYIPESFNQSNNNEIIFSPIEGLVLKYVKSEKKTYFF